MPFKFEIRKWKPGDGFGISIERPFVIPIEIQRDVPNNRDQTLEDRTYSGAFVNCHEGPVTMERLREAYAAVHTSTPHGSFSVQTISTRAIETLLSGGFILGDEDGIPTFYILGE